jgi:crotonobetainyl-CoA:carnitine CoA-transferase CaiB-like acyl-CoA transferase
MQVRLPLAGIRVIDFGRFIAGPYCAMLLADMGADVIRVDRRQGSEDRYIAAITESGEGGGFLSLNRNKRNLTLDTSKPESAEIIRRLVQGADVVVANLPNNVLKSMRLDYESLKSIKPDIILARISTFGPDGPYANRVGFDTVAQAMSGAMGLTGFAGTPVRDIVPFEDYGTALHTAFGVVVALYHRAQTGEGQIVDGSLLATASPMCRACWRSDRCWASSGSSWATQAFTRLRPTLTKQKTGGLWFRPSAMTCLPVGRGWWDTKISSAIRALPATSFAPITAMQLPKR